MVSEPLMFVIQHKAHRTKIYRQTNKLRSSSSRNKLIPNATKAKTTRSAKISKTPLKTLSLKKPKNQKPRFPLKSPNHSPHKNNLPGRCIFYNTEERLKYHTQIHCRSARGKNAKGKKISGIEPMGTDGDQILVRPVLIESSIPYFVPGLAL
jgi:hypothetical protein